MSLQNGGTTRWPASNSSKGWEKRRVPTSSGYGKTLENQAKGGGAKDEDEKELKGGKPGHTGKMHNRQQPVSHSDDDIRRNLRELDLRKRVTSDISAKKTWL